MEKQNALQMGDISEADGAYGGLENPHMCVVISGLEWAFLSASNQGRTVTLPP